MLQKLVLMCPKLSPCVLLEVRSSSSRGEEARSLSLVPTHCFTAAFFSFAWVFFLLCSVSFISTRKVDHSVLLLKLEGRTEFR